MGSVRQAVVYGKPRQRECAAVAEGLEALGAAVRWRDHGWFDPATGVFDDADLIVTFGQRLWSKQIAEAYRTRGVPVLTVDLPPLRVADMTDTYRALWLNHVNWMPHEAMSANRLLAMLARSGVRLFEQRMGERVLLCGQCAEDAAHGMGAMELRDWFQDAADAISERAPVVWRPHPRDRFSLDGFEMSDSDVPIAEVLAQDWLAVATLNSTVGPEAIVSGLPVFCHETSFYAPIANTDWARVRCPRWPSLGERIAFLSRLAWTQWTFTELASGEAVAFILEQIRKRPQVAA